MPTMYLKAFKWVTGQIDLLRCVVKLAASVTNCPIPATTVQVAPSNSSTQAVKLIPPYPEIYSCIKQSLQVHFEIPLTTPEPNTYSLSQTLTARSEPFPRRVRKGFNMADDMCFMCDQELRRRQATARNGI